MSGLETETATEQLKEIVTKVGDLSLSCDSAAKAPERINFGKIEAVIDELGLVTVKPNERPTNLLTFGTEVFIQQVIPGLNEHANFTLIGHVEDIFGPVDSPMYAIQLLSTECSASLKQQCVYYINNSDRKFIRSFCSL